MRDTQLATVLCVCRSKTPELTRLGYVGRQLSLPTGRQGHPQFRRELDGTDDGGDVDREAARLPSLELRRETGTHRGGARHHGGQREESRTADRKSTRLNSSHSSISYAVFCLKKKKK